MTKNLKYQDFAQSYTKTSEVLVSNIYNAKL